MVVATKFESCENAIYVAPEGNTENDLSKEIFPEGWHPYVAHCAECLLQIEPNGNICVGSPNRDDILKVKQFAEHKLKARPISHANHADHVCVISTRQIGAFTKARMSSPESRNAKRAILGALRDQGTPYPLSHDLTIHNHVRDLLKAQGEDNEESFWFLMVTKRRHRETHTTLELCLPGGRRWFGESSWDVAKRKTDSRASLYINENWEDGDSFGVNGYRYFMLRPMLDELKLPVMEEATHTCFYVRGLPGYISESRIRDHLKPAGDPANDF
jgi:hypothetical protein